MITDRSGSDFGTKEAFAIAAQPDGTVLVVWHACLENGDGSGCGVFGRVLKADGTVAGEAFTVPTTTTGDQTNPSAIALPEGFAVGWRDDSAQEPDPSGSAVRARIIYPDTDGSAAR